MKTKIGILLPTREIILKDKPPGDAHEILEISRYAENQNLDSLWVGDSILAKPRLDPLITLAAVATITENIRLGTSIYIPSLRDPVILAHTIMSINLIAGGRLMLGVGAGGTFNQSQIDEWEILNIDPTTRGSRLDEILNILRLFSTQERIEFKGQHFEIKANSLFHNINAAQTYPILCVCHGRNNIQNQFIRAAKHQGLISISDYPNELQYAIRRLEDYSRELSMPNQKYQAVFYMTININDNKSIAVNEADSFINKYYGINIWQDRWGPFGEASKIIDRANEYVEAGATTLIFRFASFNQMEQIERFCNQIQNKIK